MGSTAHSTGATRAAKRLAEKLAAHPRLVQGPPSRQVQRFQARKALKRLIAQDRKLAISQRRKKKVAS